MSKVDYFSLVAKAIQSDDKGLGFFTTEEGLTDFLVGTLRCNEADANQTARHMLNEDRRGNRYYYSAFESSIRSAHARKVSFWRQVGNDANSVK